MKRRRITVDEIEAGKTSSGGFAAEQLRAWGVRWPPERGWRKRILHNGVPASCPFPHGFAGETLDIVPGKNPLLAFAQNSDPADMPPGALEIFTDGSWDPKAGVGGWGFVVTCGHEPGYEASGSESATTSNRMELQAVIEALQWLGPSVPAVVWTDSAAVVRGCAASRLGWRRGSWTVRFARADLDLWTLVETLLAERIVDIRWTRGHAGRIGNERADALAAARRSRT